MSTLSTSKRLFWTSVKDSDDPEDIQAYLTKYPDGYFVDLANDKLAKLKGAQIASAESTKNSTTTERSATPSAGQTVQPPQSEQVSFVAQNQTVYAKNGGQVRAQPDGHAALLAKLQTNTEVTATGVSSDGKWWRVTTADGQTGYMHKTVVSEQPIQTASAAPSQAPLVQQQPMAGLPMPTASRC